MTVGGGGERCHFHLHAYKMQIVQVFFLMPDNKLRHFQFTKYIFSKVKAGENDL